jgi:tetratricopeptide (TPR) repeat protein
VRKQLDDAISDVNEAIRLNSLDAQAWNTRGMAYLKKRDFGRAVDDYTAAIALLPSPVIYQNRGFAYEAQSRQREAIDDFQFALEGDPSLVEARDALKRLGAPVDATSQTSQRLRQGAALAENSCSGCHAVGSSGDSPQKNVTEFRNYYKKQPLFALKSSITRAMREIHYETNDQNLKSIKVLISDAEIDSVVAYINSLSTAARLGLSETTGSGGR